MVRRPDIHHVGSFFSTDAGGAPNSSYGSLGTTDGVPWSTNIPGLQDFLGTISSMQVPTLGVFTPWGKLVQAPTLLGWGVAPLSAPPDTNILAFEFAQVAQLLNTLGFGQPAFLAYLSDDPIPPDAVSASLLDTPYELYDSGIAVYSQADTTGIPKMQFLYWISLRGAGDTSGGASHVGQAAASVGAKLCFAQQVDITSTSTRAPPEQADVSAVAQMQYPTAFGLAPSNGNGPVPNGNGPVPNGPAPIPNGNGNGNGTTEEASMVGPVIVGVLAAILGVAVGRGLGKGRRS
jgi:hypothetical protein